MIRKVFSLLPVVLMFLGVAKAQIQIPCSTDEVNETYKKSFPEIAKYEEQLSEYIKESMSTLDVSKARSKGTAFGDDDILHIPVVVHVVHDYGNTDYVSDDDIFELMDQINEIYMKRNSDTSQVIAPFKSYIGNPKVMFHLATKDPAGRPTTGITHHRSYLTDGGDDQAKFDQWDPGSYLNIWTIQRIGRGISNGVVAAYAVFPTSAAAFPYNDGIITSAGSMLSNKTIPHEIGHILGLFHPWGNVAVATDCTGDDEVDDTPPTTGHFGNGNPYGATASGSCNNASLYDTSCTNNVVSLSKQLLDTLLSPKVDSGNKGFDYIPRTNMSMDAIRIYPSNIGEEFEITHYKQNSAGVFNVVNVFGTKKDSVGLQQLGASNVSTSNTAKGKADITFSAYKYLWVDSFNIYPTTVGDTFTIVLTKQNGDTVKVYTDTTKTSSGAQVVPFSAFIANAAGYTLRITRNPGLISDSLTKGKLDSLGNANQLKKLVAIDGVLIFDNYMDTAGQDASTAATAFKGRYNYFYDWSVRYDALTTTDSSAQTVSLGYKVIPDTTYRLTLTKNPGVYNDMVGAATYNKSIPCVIDILNETTDGRYDLLYGLRIRYGYIKNCIDYPDTVNTQNIMDYANCPIMFTHLQVKRMRAVLASDIGKRGRLVNDTTHVRTGILDKIGGVYGQRIDMKPIPDLSVESATLSSTEPTYFLCAGGNNKFEFRQRSWRDTITSVEWTFNRNATTSSVTQTTVGLINDLPNVFNEPGWVDITLKATGNGTGDSTIEFKNVVYAADGDNKINPVNGFFMEFDKNDASNPIDKWPIFNYYNNASKWSIAENVGYYDNSCIVYNGFDKRTGPELYTGTPKGDRDDFFTPAFDLSGMTGTECRLNFLSSGAFTVSDSRLMQDTLEISYSTDCGQRWQKLKELSRAELANKGVVPIQYSPLYYGDWELRSIDIPMAARQGKVFFRFRFRPGVDDINNFSSRTLQGTGNNYYIDRINISPYKLGVNTLLNDSRNIVLAPNPTTGNSQLIIKSKSKEQAQVQVTDVTGKVVYMTQQQLNGDITTIEIPASVISVKGIYMVHVLAGEQQFTEKLVSY